MANLRVMLETNKYKYVFDALTTDISSVIFDNKDNEELENALQKIEEKSRIAKFNIKYNEVITLLIEIIDKKEKLDEKRQNKKEAFDCVVKDIEQAKSETYTDIIHTEDKDKRKYMEDCVEIVFSFFDEMMQTKIMIVEAEVIIYELALEIYHNKQF
ncbi:hypothetical protein BDAP_001664 [Binucleata daphniae]